MEHNSSVCEPVELVHQVRGLQPLSNQLYFSVLPKRSKQVCASTDQFGLALHDMHTQTCVLN